MRILSSFKFFDKTTEVGDSNVFQLGGIAEKVVLSVTGTSTTMEIIVYGKVDNESSDYFPISVMSTNGNTSDTKITKNGVYAISSELFSQIYISIKTVTGGNITVYGRAGSVL